MVAMASGSTITAGKHHLRVPDRSAAELLHREIFQDRVYAPSWPLACCQIVDCGANVGASVSFFAQAFPEANILCFEPDPTSFTYLVENIERNGIGPRVTPINAALGASEGQCTFYASPKGAYSLRMSVDESRMGGVGVPVIVSMRCLSSLLPAWVDLLKMDIEGGEYAVVEDLSRSGSLARVGALVMEVHHRSTTHGRLPRLLTTLEEAGFDCTLAASPRENEANDPFQDILVWASRATPM